NIKTEILNDTLILTGSVRTPLDSNRASDIASRFAVTSSTAADRQKAKVINMLAIEGEDQVMLKVTVAEMARSALKQLGINLRAQITSGNLNLQLLSENTLPLTAAQGLGPLPLAAVGLTGTGTCPANQLCLFNKSVNSAITGFGNSGAAG